MGIFTSQKKSLSDLPKPSSFDFGSVKNINLPDIKEEIGSVPFEPLREEPKVKKQIFVKMDQYKEALETINKIRDKIKDADSVLNELRSMKDKEDMHLQKWHKDLEIIKEKLKRMDEVLYEIDHE